jgi:outer membrane protein assembly factor BamA
MFRVAISFCCVFLASSLWADCAPDYRSDKKSGIFIQDFHITGTSSLSSADLLNIRSKLIGACVDEDPDDLKQLVRQLFQNKGYYAAEVKNLDIHVLDGLERPKPINLEAEVAEGQIYKFGQVSFVGNHAFQIPELRDSFSLKTGERFNRSSLAKGFDGIKKLYGRNGFGDLAFIPESADSGNSTVNLTVTIEEGPRYHMGKLVIVGKQDDIVPRLQTAWGLSEGAVFDFSYPQEYRHSIPEATFSCGGN